MSGVRKHGLHLHNLALPALAAGSAVDTSVQFQFNAFPDGAAAAAGDKNSRVDPGTYQVVEANFSTDAILTGQGTNYASVVLQHYNAAGTLVDDVRVVFSATGVVTVAKAPVNLNVAVGAVATGAGTGVLANPTGVRLPWTLATGDSVVLARVSNNATGLATPAVSATFAIAAMGA